MLISLASSTSGMAEDVIVLLDYIGWTEQRSVHVVGVSLGGMIAQGTLAIVNDVVDGDSNRLALQSLRLVYPNGLYPSHWLLPPQVGIPGIIYPQFVCPQTLVHVVHQIAEQFCASISVDWCCRVDEVRCSL
jgi:pimeloyl-ACP methyl ester carboxylesterase